MRLKHFVEARELRLRRLAVGFVGGEEMRHHAFKAERRARAEARKDRGQIAGQHALAAHAGVDLKMNGQRARRAPAARAAASNSSSCQSSQATGVSSN